MMTVPLRRSSGWITAALLLVLALALAGSAQAPAGTSILPAGTLAPTDTQRATARKVGRILEEAHSRRARRQDVGRGLPPLSGIPRRPAQLLPRQRPRRVQRLSPAVRRHDPHRR